MTKDLDVSAIDVGWRVQLRIERPGPIPAGEWLTIKKLTSGIASVNYKGECWHFSVAEGNILAALPPEPAKDPFAVGEWVVCVVKDFPSKIGDIIQVSQQSKDDSLFRVGGDGPYGYWPYYKSRFRPATPEEIAAHLEKNDMAGKPVIPCDADPKPLTSEDCELKITSAISFDADAEDDGKITFTVCGREFFVGQRVWATFGVHGRCVIGDPLVVCGALVGFDKLSVRKPESHSIFSIHPNSVSDTAHEWQFGDQASHPEHGTVLVIDMTEPESFQCASPSDPEIFIDPAELTFIRRTGLGV